MPSAAAFGDHLIGTTGRLHLNGVEPRAVHDRAAARLDARHEERGQAVYTLGNATQPVGAVVGGVHAGDVRQQHLRRADVRGCLLAANVLLTRLQREAQRRPTLGVGAHTDEPTGEGTGILLTRRDERRMRTAEAHRHTEALRRPDHDVGAERARRRQQHTSEQIGRDHRDRAAGVERVDHGPVVDHRATRAGVGEQRSEATVDVQLSVRPDDELDADRLGACREDRDRLRVGVGIDEERGAITLRQPVSHRHRLGRRRRLVQQRRVRRGPCR